MGWQDFLAKAEKSGAVSKAALAAFFVSAIASPTGATQAHAREMTWEEGYFTLSGGPMIEELDASQVAPEDEDATPAPTGGTSDLVKKVTEIEVILDKVINMGKKVWAIVEANKPVVTLEGTSANALPSGVSGWEALQGWQTPSVKLYRFYYTNFWGMKVVDMTLRVLYTHGGSYQGKGRYLTHVTIVPANLRVLWAYNFNATVSVPSVTNAGTAESPLAAAQLLMSWKVTAPFVHEQSSRVYYVKGDGTIQDLSGGN